ncbi:C-type lectin domain family 6 member A-like, partial [Centroberyx affinis]|uniref:C-type lectin domain family 6 member A-like n=1 Tax=Centroberyx affinis TaxID=166261 RepID=UPI003A5BCC6E
MVLETKPATTDAAAREETGTSPPYKLATVCLGLLCFLLLATVIGVSVQYDRDYDQLSRDLANHTAEKQQLLASYQNLTEERGNLQSAISELNRAIKDVGSCSDGWVRFGCSCYYVSTTNTRWRHSRQNCISKGADLVIINSREEMMFLNNFGAQMKFWIGLTDPANRGDWRWTDGSQSRTTYWQPGEPRPSFRGTQSCAAFNSFHAGIFEFENFESWSSEFCDDYIQW